MFWQWCWKLQPLRFDRFLGRPARVVLVLAALVPGGAYAATPGTAGFLSLRLGAGARASGMGDAQVSVASDATAAYWNPAGLSSVQGTSFTLAHQEWLETVRMETASLAHATDLGTFGLHFSGMYLDKIERHSVAGGEPEGHFNVFEIAVSGAYGLRILPEWDVGVAVKGLHTKLDDVSASGWAVDFGVRHLTRIPGLTFGGAVQNLGPRMTFIEDSFLLPATGRFGADYQRAVASLQGDVVVAFDLLWPVDGDVRQHVGMEYTYQNLASLRFGYRGNYDSQGITFGAGLQQSSYHLDYTYAEIKNDLGTSHRFSFSVDLP